MAKQQAWELYNRLVVLLTHLLKWRYQSRYQGPSWELTIKNQRAELSKQYRQAPSLKSVEQQEFLDAYDKARREASRETQLKIEVFPEEPPFTLAEARHSEFWPAAVDQD